jgi:hypothetical protein
MRTLVEDLIAVCIYFKGHAWFGNEQDQQVLSDFTAEYLE